MVRSEFVLLALLNALMYLATFTYFFKKKKKLDLGVMILLLYLISNIVSVFYYSIDLIAWRFVKITLFPYIYLYSMLIVSIYPLLRFNYRSIRFVSANGSGLFIKYFSILILFITIEPFVENILLVAKLDNSNYVSLGELYARKFEGESVSKLSWLGRKLNYVSILFSTTIAVFFFYLLTQPNVKKWLKWGLLIVILNTILTYFSSSNRAGVLSYFLFLLTVYLLFYNSMPVSIVRKINLYGAFFLIFTLLLTLIITVARFNYNDSSFTLLSWIGLYAGEGSLKFNNDLWYIKYHTNGDDLFCFLKDIIGLDTFTDNFTRDSYYSMKNGIQIENFYTFIGDIFYDFGLIGTPIFCISIFLLLNYLTKKRKFFPLEIVFLIAILAHVFFMGFAAYIHRAYSAQFALIFPLFICLILMFNRFKSKLI